MQRHQLRQGDKIHDVSAVLVRRVGGDFRISTSTRTSREVETTADLPELYGDAESACVAAEAAARSRGLSAIYVQVHRPTFG